MIEPGMTLATAEPGDDRACGDDPRAGLSQTGLSRAVLAALVANRDRFLGFLERRVGRREVAEEILQDAFVRSLARGRTLREDESAIAWFYRLLRNAIVDRARADAAERRGRAALAAEPAAGEPDQELLDTICACVTSLVDTLRPEYAAAIRRVELDGESLPAFAAATGITRGNAAVRLYRARQALRRRIEESCGPCAAHGGWQCECRTEHGP
jgi:RNA polymerase sigma-70 factor (ECF subfamily)